MSVLYILLPLALVFAAGALGAFWWAVAGEQMDDLDTPAWRMLFEDPPQDGSRRA